MTIMRPAAPANGAVLVPHRPDVGVTPEFIDPVDAPEITIVMPCLNEETAVGECVRKAAHWIAHYGYTGEVVVVDNGSTDRSAEYAEAAGARVIHESRRGYGRAYLTGLAAARGKFIVMGDADDTYDFESLRDLLEPLEAGTHDLVIGSRLKGQVSDGAMPWAHRYIGTPAINALMGLFTGVRVSDSQSGMRAFTRGAYHRMGLRSEGMEFASEMVVRSARCGLRITETPIPYRPRQGESKLRTFRDGWRHLRYLLLSAPNVVFIAPGLLFVILGIATSLISFAWPGGLEAGSLTWQPIFASTIFLVVGSTAIALGVLSKRHAASRGLVPRDRWTNFYDRYLDLETLLVAAGVLIAVGAVVDVVLFAAWVSDASVPRGLALAALAQSFLIMGANLALAAFLAVMMDQSESEAGALEGSRYAPAS
jgi:glycosyltransferase involved in cell wall biosynthesis